MEALYSTDSTDVENQCRIIDIASAYYLAKKMVLCAGYENEIAWQSSLHFENVTESDFLREHAWVVLSTGMRESVIRQRFSIISRAFFNWESSKRIVDHGETCHQLALEYFNHPRKISAIVHAARVVDSVGFLTFKELIRLNPFETLQILPFIGPVTSSHLVKNLGLPYAKADRHLVRLANSAGYSDVQRFCSDIGECTGDSVPVVDIVLWRFATIKRGYLSIFSSVARRGQE